MIKNIPRLAIIVLAEADNNQDKQSSPITTVNSLASQRCLVLPNSLINDSISRRSSRYTKVSGLVNTLY